MIITPEQASVKVFFSEFAVSFAGEKRRFVGLKSGRRVAVPERFWRAFLFWENFDDFSQLYEISSLLRWEIRYIMQI